MAYYINGRPHTHEVALDIDIFTDIGSGDVTTIEQMDGSDYAYLINDRLYHLTHLDTQGYEDWASVKIKHFQDMERNSVLKLVHIYEGRY